MPLKVYIDLLFLINLFADFLLLWMTAFWRRRQVKGWRILLGSLVGSLYVIFLVVGPITDWFSWSGKVLLSIVMILITFGFKRFSVFLKDMLVFYMVCFGFGGGVLGLTFLLQSQESLLNGFLLVPGNFMVPQAVVLGLVLGFGLMLLLSRFYFQVIEVGKRRDTYLVNVTIEILGKRLNCVGLLDTGNQLYEPITRVPVMILEARLLQGVLPEALYDYVKRGDMNFNDSSFLDNAIEWQNRIRFIPYRGVGKGNHLMICIIPDFIELQDDQQKFTISRVRIGLTPDILSGDNSYSAILHPDLFSQNQTHKNEVVQHVDSLST